MIRRSQTRMSGDSLKREGSLESPQILAKVPKVENDQVIAKGQIKSGWNRISSLKVYLKLNQKVLLIILHK